MAPAPVSTADQSSWSSTVKPIKPTVAHPLCPLSAAEISRASELVQSKWPAKTSLQFKTVTLEEPPKSILVPYLDAEHNAAPLPSIDRKAFISYYIRNTVRTHLCVVMGLFDLFANSKSLC